MNESVI